MASSTSTSDDQWPTWLGHPRGLFLLFFVEMWERFSFYGMRALLIFYLTQHFLFSDRDAAHAYGAYMSLIYISPLMGGYLADRYIGQRKAVLFGGIIIAIGHIILGLKGDAEPSAMGLGLFWLGLATVITGTGFLKANVSALVGGLYPRDDMRRDPAYTIFYMGINVGATLGPIICGYLGQRWGWHWGFGAASVGMMAGVIGFALCKPLLHGGGEPPEPARLAERVGGIVSRESLVYASSLLSILLCWWLIQRHAIVGWMLAAASALVLLYILWEAFRMERVDRDRMLAALFLLAINPLFWGLYEQTGSSLSLFTDRYTDREILGFNVPASMFQSVNAAYILIFGPVMAALWIWLAKRRWEPSAPAKFGIALALVGAGFLVLVAGTGAPGTLTPVLFIFLLYLCHTLGELCLSPVGLSAMSKLAPTRMIGLMMGIWFLAMALGEYVAGMIAAATGGAEGAASREGVLGVYQQIGWWSVGAGIAVVAVAPIVKRRMHQGTSSDSGRAREEAPA